MEKIVRKKPYLNLSITPFGISMRIGCTAPLYSLSASATATNQQVKDLRALSHPASYG